MRWGRSPGLRERLGGRGGGGGLRGCRCRVCAEAEELSRPCWSPGLRQWELIGAWSCRGVGVFCPGFPRGDEGGGCWHLESLLPSVVAWGGRGAPGPSPCPERRAKGRAVGALQGSPRAAVVALAACYSRAGASRRALCPQ